MSQNKCVSRQRQFSFGFFQRLPKSLFLCLILAGLLFGLTAVFLWQNNGHNTSLARDVIDNGQFLLSTSCHPSPEATLCLINGTTLQPSAPPSLVKGRVLAVLAEGDYGVSQSRQEIELYPVQKNDTTAAIAQKFDISLNTLLWANNLTSKSVLKEGQELVILPISGAMHIAQKNETVKSLAKLYQASVQDIIDFNQLGDYGNIKAGDFLVIPGGVKPKTVPKYNSVPLPKSYFIAPLPAPCMVSQGLHWFNAVDFNNNRCGDPVFAAAAGEVQRVGFTATGGNFVRILHNNGAVTYYGHLSSFVVTAGKSVDQGQIIGYVGHTGLTIPAGEAGCHLHFDVRFAANPFAKYVVGAKLGR